MKHADGHAAPGPFELSGGCLSLDFANTWGNHADTGSDRLRDYRSLLAFGRQAGALGREAAGALSKAAARNAAAAAEAFAFARELRETIYNIFSSRAAGRNVPPRDLGRLNAVLGRALSQRQLVRRDEGFCWSWAETDTNDLRLPIWPIIDSAASLLTSEGFDRVRECNAHDCNWLFLDRSRGGSRRWCSMSSCGNRAKARRHYRRQRAT